jgi:Domain of unknown function (DUF4062)
MVSFLKRRFQVFVSSTYTDLREERQAAVEAILSAGHIPAGMELFAAGDESQMEVIKQWIDESDVYLLVLGGRYGSIEPTTRKSYIQLEYEYALQQNKPLFSCVMSEEALNKRLQNVGQAAVDKYGEKLEVFRTLVLTKMVRAWDDKKDIKIAIGETLFQFSRREDIGGWVRQGQEVNVPALADEIARLSKENARLRALAENVRPEELINGLTFAEMKEHVQSTKLLDFFLERLPTLIDETATAGTTGIDGPPLTELSLLGLVNRKWDEAYGAHYSLSQAGRVFLSRFNVERRKATDGTQSEAVAAAPRNRVLSYFLVAAS